MGPRASEHDVFAGILAARLRLPEPPAADVAREVAALRALYGPHGPRPRGGKAVRAVATAGVSDIYSGLILASRMTVPHLAISRRICAAASSGVLVTGSRPSAAKRSAMSGSATIALISR